MGLQINPRLGLARPRLEGGIARVMLIAIPGYARVAIPRVVVSFHLSAKFMDSIVIIFVSPPG